MKKKIILIILIIVIFSIDCYFFFNYIYLKYKNKIMLETNDIKIANELSNSPFKVDKILFIVVLMEKIKTLTFKILIGY